MKNKDEIKRDALQFCLEIIKTIDGSTFSHIKYIAMAEEKNWMGISQVYIYKEVETPFFLSNLGIIKFLPLDKDISIFSPKGKGLYKIYFDYQKAKNWLEKEINEIINNSYEERKDFFYIDINQTLKIFNGITTISIPFCSKKSSNMFYLIHSFVEYLKMYGKMKDGWIEVFVSREFIKQHIKNIFNTEEISNEWIKSTRSHLIEKIPKNLLDKIIKIGNYDRKNDGYYFAIKIPC